MNPEIRPEVKTYREMVASAVEAATRAYFATDPKSLQRLDRAIKVENSQRLAHFMGVSMPDIARAYLRGTPKEYRQDYLDTVYDEGILSGKESEGVAREFKLLPPTLIATSLSSSLFRRT